jgi:hypothetical protein
MAGNYAGLMNRGMNEVEMASPDSCGRKARRDEAAVSRAFF